MTVEGGVWTMHPVLVAACAEDRKTNAQLGPMTETRGDQHNSGLANGSPKNKPRVSKFSAVFKRYLDELSGTTPQASPDNRAGACAWMVYLVLALLSPNGRSFSSYL